jgi:valyl-tRNA synthetase
MAISKNMLRKGVTGSINKQLVIREVNNKIVISAYPDFSNRVFTKKQLAYQEKMRQVNREVKLIKSDEQLRNAAMLRLNVTRNKLHHALLKERLLMINGDD